MNTIDFNYHNITADDSQVRILRDYYLVKYAERIAMIRDELAALEEDDDNKDDKSLN